MENDKVQEIKKRLIKLTQIMEYIEKKIEKLKKELELELQENFQSIDEFENEKS
jgi:hypothetical protein